MTACGESLERPECPEVPELIPICRGTEHRSPCHLFLKKKKKKIQNNRWFIEMDVIRSLYSI